MQPEMFMRQLDIMDPLKYKDTPITVIGAGGIGAATVIALAKSGYENITVYDHDIIEPHNIPVQLLPMHWCYPGDDDDAGYQTVVGQHKVMSLQLLVHDLTDVMIKAQPYKYVNQPLGEVVIVGVDSLEARRKIWEMVCVSIDTEFLVDGRMALTSFDIYGIDMTSEEQVNAYEKSLEGEASELPCTGRATMYNALIIAGHIVQFLVARQNEWPYPSRFVYNVRSWKTLPLYGTDWSTE